MTIVTIKKYEWETGIQRSRTSYRISAPAFSGEALVFRELEPDELPVMDGRLSHLSPKSVVFPQTEPLLEFEREPGARSFGPARVVEKEIRPRAVIGIRPYDYRALVLMKLNVDTPEYQDPYWLSAWEACTFIGLADTHPGQANFSTSCGTGPFDETGLDVLLVDTGDAFLARLLTPAGSAWAEAAGFTTPAGDSAEATIEHLKQVAEEAIVSGVDVRPLETADTLTLYNQNFWEAEAFACINCGTCTYVCPTCWCFDIQDETRGDTGQRLRIWDTCMSPLYSLHASGHNPRAEGWQRMRNRFMHKLKYFPEKYHQGIMCVGCGRCVTACPANIDIREICQKMAGKGGAS